MPLGNIFVFVVLMVKCLKFNMYSCTFWIAYKFRDSQNSNSLGKTTNWFDSADDNLI